MLTRDTSDGGTEFAWQFASKYPSNVYFCVYISLRIMLAALARCNASSSLSSLWVSAARWQNLFRRPKRHHVLVCDLRRLEFGKECGLFLKKRVENVYLLTSSANLKTGSSRVLTMRNSSIKESNSASAMPSGHRGLDLSSPFSLTLSALLNKGRNI